MTFLLAQASQPQSSQTAIIIVAVISAISALGAGYFAYKAQKKQTDESHEDHSQQSMMKERQQLADEWKALREYQGVQLAAAQREIETVRNQVKKLTEENEDKDRDLYEMETTLIESRTQIDALTRGATNSKRQLDAREADIKPWQT